MSDVLCWMIPFLLFPLTASLTFNPTNNNESILSPRLLLPQNAPYLSRDTNSSALNNITSNITSGSQKFIWIIEDTYNSSNFFQWVTQFVVRTPIQRASLIRSFNFFTGEDPTQYVLFTSALPELTPSQWNRQVCDYSPFTPLAPGDSSSSYSYVDNTTAFAHNLSYISWDGKVIMKGDDTNTLQAGQNRERCRLRDLVFLTINLQSVSEFPATKSITLAFSFWI
jgi:hypothetical protein